MRNKKESKIIPFPKDKVQFKSINPQGEDLTIEKVRLMLKNDKISDEEAIHIINTVTLFAEIICKYAKALQYYPESVGNTKNNLYENNSKKAA